MRASLLQAVPAEDGDTHDQMVVDEPIPYPTADIAYNLFGATTENGPIYKDPSLPGGGVTDPVPGQEVIAVGTFRYDPDHGWYEIHSVKGTRSALRRDSPARARASSISNASASARCIEIARATPLPRDVVRGARDRARCARSASRA